MRMSNPSLKPFQEPQTWDDLALAGGGAVTTKPATMSVAGTVTATGTLLGICVAVAVFSWGRFEAMAQNGQIGQAALWTFGAMIVNFVLWMVMSRKQDLAMVLGWLYAGLEGVFLAGASMFIGYQFLNSPDEAGATPEMVGLIFQAAMITFSIAAATLIAFTMGFIRVGPVAMKMFFVAIGGVMIYWVALLLLPLLGIDVPNLWASGSPLGIGFSLLMVGLATFGLVLDYQIVDDAIKQEAPKKLEWYAGVAILTSLVWIYIEVLRLLAKLKDR